METFLAVLLVYVIGIAPAFSFFCFLDALTPNTDPLPLYALLVWPYVIFMFTAIGLYASWDLLFRFGFPGMRVKIYDSLAQGGRTHAAEGKRDA